MCTHVYRNLGCFLLSRLNMTSQAHKINTSADAQQRTVRFRAMMQSGERVDTTAQVVQTPVIVHEARASIEDRAPVPLYHVVGELRQAAHRENIIIETGLAPAPTADSKYCLEDSHHLHQGIRNGSVQLRGDSILSSRAVAIASNFAGLIAMVALLWYSAVISGDPSPPEPPPQVQAEVQHGLADALPEPAIDPPAEGAGRNEEDPS